MPCVRGKMKPRTYQKEAAKFLIDKKRAILGDTMGLGKSCSALTAAKEVGGKTLIVCPSYVRGVWAAPNGELAKWWRDASAIMLKGTKPSPIDADVVVIHYDILHAWVDALRDWGPVAMIIDEAHALMSSDSRRTKACRAIANSCEYVWGLTGTPLTNRPRDLFGVVDTIRPGTFGSFFKFALRFCDAHKITVGGGSM